MPSIVTRRLTEAHRKAQLALGTATVRRMRAAWRLLDPTDIDGTFEDWLITVVPIVQAQRSASSTLAANYLNAVRAVEIGVAAPFVPVVADRLDHRMLTTSMLVTGPYSIRSNLARMMPMDRAVDIAEGRTAAAAMRHALNGGRETVVRTVNADRRARGWQRVTSAKACDFCSMLAGRGSVYSEASADFQAHDGCSCAAEPVYR